MPQLILSWVVLGVLAGLLVYLWSPRKLPGGLWSDLGIGIAGATIGGYLIAFFTGLTVTASPVTWGSAIVTLLSAAVALIVAQGEGHRRATRK